jgi:phosphotransferase system HPr (HPr) family protein
MQTRQLIVQCEGGLHLRVAAQIVKEAKQHRAEVHLRCAGCPRANACSIFELLKLGAGQGTPLEITAEGPDEDAALSALEELFTQGAGI